MANFTNFYQNQNENIKNNRADKKGQKHDSKVCEGRE